MGKAYLTILFLMFTCRISYGIETVYGEQPSLKNSISLQEALKVYEKTPHKTLLIEGKVVQTCQKKGCWMSVESGQKSIRVTFKNYSFFVPKSLQNRKVLIQGTLVRKVVSEAERKHYLEDAGASMAEIAKIKGSRDNWRLIATGVKLI